MVRNIGNLRKPSDVRRWMCRQPDKVSEATYDPTLLVASVAVAALLSSPTVMVTFAITAFLTGVGIYLGFIWVHDLDALASQGESRSVFICFMVSLGFCGCFYGLPLFSKFASEAINRIRSGQGGEFYGYPSVNPQAPYGQRQRGEPTSFEPLYNALVTA